MFRKTAFYKRWILPVLVDLLKFFLWFMEPLLPAHMINEIEDLLEEYYGKAARLPNRIERVARILPPHFQAALMNEAECLLMLWDAEAKLAAATEPEEGA